MSDGGRTILLVDDEPLVCEELGGLLADEGYRVATARDGDEGLARFREAQPDMVITDVRMPRRDGLSLAQAIRAEAPWVPIAVITGHGSEAMVLDALRAGVTDFLRKPVRVEALEAALRRMETALRLARAPEAAPLPAAAALAEQRWRYVVESDPGAVPAVVRAVLARCAADLPRPRLQELSLALGELLLNAIEHGNLGLTFEEKSAALGGDRLDALLAERRRSAPYRHRRAKIIARRFPDRVEVEVADQGEGFDWRRLPDPDDTGNLLSDHGRGVILARLSVDELRYSARGNRVTVVKRTR